MKGGRKLILSMATLGMVGLLAWTDHLSAQVVEAVMWILLVGIGGNAAEHWTQRRGKPPEA